MFSTTGSVTHSSVEPLSVAFEVHKGRVAGSSCLNTYLSPPNFKTMAEIRLEGMSFFAHHGYYIHEQTRGNHYLVDVSVHADIEGAALDDDLHQTVNYEIIYRICSDIMNEPCKLIETVAYRIAHEVRKSFPYLGQITVVMHKMQPELGGPVNSAQVIYKLD